MSFKHDSTGVNPDAYELVDEGWHALRIVEAEEMVSKNGHPMVLAKCKVIGNQYPDSTIWLYVPFIPKGQKGDGINVHFRKSIGVPFGGVDIVDPEDWVGKTFKGYVVKEEYDGKVRNKISKVEPLEENLNQAAFNAQAPIGKDSDIPF